MIFRRPPKKIGVAEAGESLAARLPALMAEAQELAGLMRAGDHGRRRKGQGSAFWQFRRYQPEDGAAKIDWRQSAKGDHLFVREKEWETAAIVWIWPDLSPSMRWRSGSGTEEKAERALLLAAALGFALVEGGELVGFSGSPLAPASDAKGVARLVASLADAAFIPADFPGPGKGRGHMALISDFLQPPRMIDQGMKAIVDAGLRGHLLHLLDPVERDWPFEGRILFSGLKGEGELLISSSAAVRDDYLARLAALRDGLSQSARRLGWSFGQAATDQPPLEALLALARAIEGDKR